VLTRRLGRTGHMSSVAILGAFAFTTIDQDESDALMEKVIAARVNHIDVAPSYGESELRLGPWLARERDRFFLGCKTMERTAAGATAEMQASLKRLQVDAFDLYQIHAITTQEELDAATGPGSVLEAMIEARDAGLTRYIGITGHGMQSPALFREALRRFDFDTVMFPVNANVWADPAYRAEAEALLAECRARDVGVMALKALARQPWGDRPHAYNTWYEPFDDLAQIRECVNFTLSQDITGLCTSGDPVILPRLLAACAQFEPMPPAQQAELMASANQYANIFA
jgi:aryl-alcohol dehydrogenase-like predicted oxidoreductase